MTWLGHPSLHITCMRSLFLWGRRVLRRRLSPRLLKLSRLSVTTFRRGCSARQTLRLPQRTLTGALQEDRGDLFFTTSVENREPPLYLALSTLETTGRTS